MPTCPDNDPPAFANRVFGCLPDGDRQLILNAGSHVTFPEGERLYREDERIRAVYFPLDAVVSLVVGSTTPHNVEIATIGNEGLVGVVAATGATRSIGRAVVQVRGEAIKLDVRVFVELLNRSAALRTIADRCLYALMRQISLNVACNRFHTDVERCAKWLLLTHDRARRDQFRLTQAFLSEMMGTRRASVNAALAQLREEGAIRSVYRTIVVQSRPDLESFACPCYAAIRRANEAVKL